MIIPSPTVPPESSHFRQSGAWFNHFKLTKVQQGNTNLTISQNLKLAPADQAAEDRELAASGITANVTGYSGLLDSDGKSFTLSQTGSGTMKELGNFNANYTLTGSLQQTQWSGTATSTLTFFSLGISCDYKSTFSGTKQP